MKTANPRLAALDAAYDHVQAALDALRETRPALDSASAAGFDAERAHRSLCRDADALLGALAEEMGRLNAEAAAKRVR